MLRHASDLLVASAVRPELLVDHLRRRGVVGDVVAAAAIGDGVGRRAACELIAEAVIGRTSAVSELCDALASTGCVYEADCLSAVNSLLHLAAELPQSCCSDDSTLVHSQSSILNGHPSA